MVTKQMVMTLLTAVFVMASVAPSVNADGIQGTYGQYGGGEQGKVLVDKLVRNPVTGEYVDNLGLNDPKYVAQNAVFFKIVVENTGNKTLDQINVVDTIPAYLEYVSGGSYEVATRKISYTFDNVRPGEKRSTVFQTRVVALEKMPAEKSILCPVNVVVASSPQDGSDEDTAQLCIEKKVMAVKVPETGDPMGLVLGLSALPTLVAGVKLRRKLG